MQALFFYDAICKKIIFSFSSNDRLLFNKSTAEDGDTYWYWL